MGKKLRLLVSVALLSFLGWRTDWAQLGQAFLQMRLELWLAAVGLYTLTQIVSAIRWQQLAVPLGFDRPLHQFVNFYFIGMFFNLLLPTSIGGDVVRAWYLDGGSSRRLPSFLSVFVDRFSGLLVLLALACVAAAFCPMALPQWIRLSVLGTATCAGLGLAFLPLLARWTKRKGGIHRLIGGMRLYLGMPGLIFSSTGLSVIVQAANVVVVWLVGLAIGAAVPASYYWIVVPMVTLMTLLPVSLNGMGVREGGMVLFLAPIGVEPATSVCLAFLWFSVFTATSLVGAAIYLFGSFSRPEERSDDGSVGGDSDQGRAGQSRQAA